MMIFKKTNYDWEGNWRRGGERERDQEGEQAANERLRLCVGRNVCVSDQRVLRRQIQGPRVNILHKN